MAAKSRTVCMFLTSGKTFTFRDATIATDNEYAVVVDYVAMSDGKEKRATFYKANVAGMAISES